MQDWTPTRETLHLWTQVVGKSGWLSRYQSGSTPARAGFWPGGDGDGMFYGYVYPEPEGFATYPVGSAGAFYHADGGQFVLPYQTVREAVDPDAVLLEFLQTTYEAADVRGGWDRAALEGGPALRGAPR